MGQWIKPTGSYLPLSGGTMTGVITYSSGKKDTDYLPLSGGTMTGSLNMNSKYITNANSIMSAYNTSIILTGYNDYNSKLQIYGGNSSTEGTFTIRVAGTSASGGKALFGSSNGTLTWGGTNVAVGSFLPLSGGSDGIMTGTIVSSAEIDVLCKDTSSEMLVVRGGTQGDNLTPVLILYGRGYSTNPGSFALTARNNSTSKVLLGKPDGTLTWNGTNVAVGSFLPLSGGTMTGTITAPSSASNDTICSSNSSGIILRTGSRTDSHDAVLALYGRNNSLNAGCFILGARNSSANCDLIGNPDGNLTWCGSPLATVSTVYDIVHPVGDLVKSSTAPVVPDSVSATWVIESTSDSETTWKRTA